MKMQFSSVVLTFFLVCNIFVIKSEEVSTAATDALRRDNVDLIEKNETVSSTTELSSNVTIEVSTTTATTTKQLDPSHLLIPPATDKAQIHNANVTTKKPSRFQAAV